MKDPTVPSLEDRKKIMFYDSSERQNRLRIRCSYDGITQSQFFRMMITGYIENDDLLYEYLKSCKKKHGIQGIQKRNKIERLRTRAENTKKVYALEDEEIQDIFDMIETETNL